MIVEIMSNPETPNRMTEECLLLAIALLLGGNLEAQTKFLEKLRSDLSNSFLIQINEIVNKTFA